MAQLFWDASALVKRYVPEMGSDTVDALFVTAPTHDLITTPWGYAETYSVLVRRLNAGAIDLRTFTTAVSALQTEVVDTPSFCLLSLDDDVIFASVIMMRQHNLNATDAAILTPVVDYVHSLPATSDPCVVVSADRRLIRAADTEGLITLDPEVLPAAGVPGFLAVL